MAPSVHRTWPLIGERRSTPDARPSRLLPTTIRDDVPRRVPISAEAIRLGGCSQTAAASHWVPNRYVSPGTSGHLRPLQRPRIVGFSSSDVAARALAWTRVLYSSFPRNEGVPGSSPGVGLKRPAKRLLLFSGQETHEVFQTDWRSRARPFLSLVARFSASAAREHASGPSGSQNLAMGPVLCPGLEARS